MDLFTCRSLAKGDDRSMFRGINWVATGVYSYYVDREYDFTPVYSQSCLHRYRSLCMYCGGHMININISAFRCAVLRSDLPSIVYVTGHVL